MCCSQVLPPLQDYRWKTEGKNGLWKYFAVQKSSFLWLFRKHLTSQKLYRVGQIYFIEGLIDKHFARLRQDFKTMYEEMECTTKDESRATSGSE